MTNLISKILIDLSKNITRKNLYKLSDKELKPLNNNSYNVLNIGAGGALENYIKSYTKLNVFSIDIDQDRNPDQVIDLCDNNFIDKLKFKPDIITCFEVLEHVRDPHIAIKNLYKTCDKDCIILLSTPFNFPIHDAPNDFYRYTKFGLNYLFRDFSSKKIIARDGWLDCIFVFLIRLKFAKSIFLKIISLGFMLIYYLFYPLIFLIQKLTSFENITTGYFIIVKK